MQNPNNWTDPRKAVPDTDRPVLCKIFEQGTPHYDIYRWTGTTWLQLKFHEWIPAEGVKILKWKEVEA